ncbi:MAG: hypothetical protein ACKO23_07025, partial [Gemmataceae bacterium]
MLFSVEGATGPEPIGVLAFCPFWDASDDETGWVKMSSVRVSTGVGTTVRKASMVSGKGGASFK